MRLRGGLLGAMALIGVLEFGSNPQPAVAFACSKAVTCVGGCRTVLDSSGDYEGVHVCYWGCSYPDCAATFAATPEVTTLVDNVAAGDVRAAVKLVTKYATSVRYDADRHALMYYSACTGNVPIGAQPLGPAQVQAVAAAIAD